MRDHVAALGERAGKQMRMFRRAGEMLVGTETAASAL